LYYIANEHGCQFFPGKRLCQEVLEIFSSPKLNGVGDILSILFSLNTDFRASLTVTEYNIDNFLTPHEVPVELGCVPAFKAAKVLAPPNIQGISNHGHYDKVIHGRTKRRGKCRASESDLILSAFCPVCNPALKCACLTVNPAKPWPRQGIGAKRRKLPAETTGVAAYRAESATIAGEHQGPAR